MPEWIDFRIPDDWRVTSIKETATVMRSGGTPSRRNPQYWNGDVPFVLIEDITSAGLYLSDTKKSITQQGLDESSAWLVPPGAVLLSMYATIGATAINTIPLATNQAILAIIPKPDYSAEFLAYALQAHKAALSARNVQATQKNINKGIVETFPIPVPPLDEQRHIAHVLSTVQTAIEQQERLIALTSELKSALLHKLFTEGLRGEKQKQTEIGLVPESWDVVELSRLLSEPLRNGHSAKESPNGKGIRTLTLTAVTRRDFSEANTKLTVANPDRVRNFWLQNGDVLVERANTPEYVGLAAIYEGPNDFSIFPDLMIRVRVDEQRIMPYLVAEFLVTPVCRKYFQTHLHSTAGNFPKIDQGTVEKIPVPLLPLDEQNEIVSILRTIDKKHSLHKAKLAILKDLFRTLLHQLMTAQIRVNELDM